MNVQWHLLWLWAWFGIGVFMYWLKRAYFLVTGPNPVANNYSDFIRRCWIPLIVRAFLDSIMFWLCFTPQFLSGGLEYLGWSSMSGVIGTITKFAPCAALFGHTADSLLDFIISTVGSKIPFLTGVLPQMPHPLPQQAIVQAAIVQTKVTALETTTTTVPRLPSEP